MEKKSILVIDDDQDVLDLVSAILETEGYDVELVSTEDTVLERLTGGARYDLIITDVWMPWMSGLQVGHFAHFAGHTTPILFMSGFADRSLEQRVQIFRRRREASSQTIRRRDAPRSDRRPTSPQT